MTARRRTPPWPRAVPALALLSLAAIPAGPAAASGSASPGAELAAACAACHGDDGAGAAIPSLIGLGQGSIVAMLLEYRSGQRSGQIMQVVAAALTPEEIRGVAAYLAAQKPDLDR